MRVFAITLFTVLSQTSCSAFFEDTVEASPEAAESTLYDIQVRSLEGEEVRLDAYRGQVALIVNTASKCGYTPQYAGLQELHETYAEQGLAVLGFPSGDFRDQEFSTAAEIQGFCTENYGVTFPLFERTGVKEGEDQSELYRRLGEATGSLPGWNFGKYLVGRDGKVLAFYDTSTKPTGDELIAAIEAALAAG